MRELAKNIILAVVSPEIMETFRYFYTEKREERCPIPLILPEDYEILIDLERLS